MGKNIGATIKTLRKSKGLTQCELGALLNVSDKTISKWESGQGYPEITQFPNLAKVFGVSIDYLFSGERKGIAVVGNIIIDLVKNLDCYPNQGMMAYVESIEKAVGGCVSNTAIDLAKIDSTLAVSAVSRVGNDENGRFVTGVLKNHGIDISQISFSSTAPTSFSDVISVSGGERTFFHAKGANAELDPDDIDLKALNCSILHAGYLLILEQIDKEDKEYGTRMARFLKQAQDEGIKTSIDIVSDTLGNYNKIVVPALKYCNYVIINEIEACAVYKINPRKINGELDIEAVKKAMLNMKNDGVKDKVIVHAKEMGICLDVKTNEFTVVNSLKIPRELIKGSVGAGDAFCAGALYGIYNNYTDAETLRFAAAAAATSLFADNSTDGMKNKADIEKIIKKYS